MRCQSAARALARRAAHEGRGKNRGPGSLFHKMCLEFLPYVLMIKLRYPTMLGVIELISTYCEEGTMNRVNWTGQGHSAGRTHIEKRMNSRRFVAIAVPRFAFSLAFEAGSFCPQASGLSEHRLL